MKSTDPCADELNNLSKLAKLYHPEFVAEIRQQGTQYSKNLPYELLNQQRFFGGVIEDNGDKRPVKKGITKLNLQTTALCAYQQAISYDRDYTRCYPVLDLFGHDERLDYMLIDFDHVLDGNGEFVNDEAEKWYSYIAMTFEEFYCEVSSSGTGLHIICRPTPGKFHKITNKDNVLTFDENNDKIKLEVFYLHKKFCHMTGKLFRCEPHAPIPQGEVVDEVVENFLRLTETQKPEKLKPTHAETRAELPADLQALDDAVNSIPYEQLTKKGYLKHSEKGAPAPGGFICPGCGSGTHAQKTGALQFYCEENHNHVHCHKCGYHADIVALLAKNYGMDDTRGKNFFDLLKRAADEFNIPYDEKIFERKPAQKNTQHIIASCPVSLLIPDDYEFSTNGITYIDGGRKKPRYIVVARTPIVPTRKYRDPISGTVKYEISILADKQWTTTEIEGRALADPRAIIALADKGALIDEPKILCRFLNAIIALNTHIARVNTYNRTGWTSNDCAEFIIPGNGDFVLRRAGFNFEKIFATRGKADVWQDMYRKLLKTGGAISAMAIGTSLVAPLVRLLNIPNVQTHLHGKSGAAKTALQKFAASIYGDPSQLLRTFAATSKNRQTVADAFNDLPTFFDELETGRDKSAELNLCSDVYRYSGGKLGEANKRNGDARDASEFKGARLMTGERQILKRNDLQGAFKRLVQIETRRGIFDDFAADIHLTAEKNFGHFGRQWLNFITTHADEIKSRYVTLATTIIKASKRHEETQITSVVATIIAVEFFDMMIENRAEFSERDTFELAVGIVETLPTFNDIDDCARALNDLRSFFDGHEKYFLHGIREERDNSTHAIETYGQKFDDNSVAFFPTALVKILEQDLGYASADKLIREFASKGLLRRGEADRYTCKRTIGNKRCSVYLFNKGVIVEADYSEDEYYDRMAEQFG